MSVQVNANQNQIHTVRRYFVGTTVLRKGQILHYQENASASDADPKLRLGSAVEAVNTDNVKYFAGVVSPGEAGKVGPCFVELLVPATGDVLEVEADGTTDIAVGDFIEPDGTLGGLIDGTEAAGDVVFIALEAFDTDATLEAIWVYKV